MDPVEFNPPNKVFVHKFCQISPADWNAGWSIPILSGEVWDWMEKHSQNPGDMIECTYC